MRFPFVMACLLALFATAAQATPTHVNVKDCYPAATPTDDAALHKAVAVALGIDLGINTACGIPGTRAYIGTVYVPPGEFVLEQPLVITKPLTITGVRAAHYTVTDVGTPPIPGGGSRIKASSATNPAKMIHVMTAQPVLISDITLDANQQPGPNSSAIFVEGHIPGGQQTTTEQEVVTIERVTIWKAVTGITLSKASKATIRSTFVKDFKIYGIVVDNGYHPDRGDSLIEGCWIANDAAATGSIGILQRASGGLKIIGNKIVGVNYGMDVGYRLLGPGSNPGPTGILIIDGNSIEAQGGASIQLIRGDASMVFTQVVISNNQLWLSPTGILFDDNTASPNPTWLKSATINGNTFFNHSAAAIAVYEADGVFIGANTFYTGKGIYLNPTGGGHVAPTNVKIGPNAFTSMTGANITNPGLATICPPSNCH